jgi:hypothetical protein
MTHSLQNSARISINQYPFWKDYIESWAWNQVRNKDIHADEAMTIVAESAVSHWVWQGWSGMTDQPQEECLVSVFPMEWLHITQFLQAFVKDVRRSWLGSGNWSCDRLADKPIIERWINWFFLLHKININFLRSLHVHFRVAYLFWHLLKNVGCFRQVTELSCGLVIELQFIC